MSMRSGDATLVVISDDTTYHSRIADQLLAKGFGAAMPVAGTNQDFPRLLMKDRVRVHLLPYSGDLTASIGGFSNLAAVHIDASSDADRSLAVAQSLAGSASHPMVVLRGLYAGTVRRNLMNRADLADLDIQLAIKAPLSTAAELEMDAARFNPVSHETLGVSSPARRPTGRAPF